MAETKARILCVDDDLDTCEMWRAILCSVGYEVMTATSVNEALRQANNEGCDLILLDSYFDDGTGIELCRMIRAFDSMTPILFCSGAAERGIKETLKLVEAKKLRMVKCFSPRAVGCIPLDSGYTLVSWTQA
jgi:DNA-binding response OmpR family regulator